MLDAAGRLQIPREYLEQFNIHRRVQVELTSEGILIRPPEREHPSHEQVASTSEQESAEPEAMEVSPNLLKMWRSLKSRFMHLAKNPNGGEQ